MLALLFFRGGSPVNVVKAGLQPGQTIYGVWDDRYKKYQFVVDGKTLSLTIPELIELLLESGKTVDDVVLQKPKEDSPKIRVLPKRGKIARKKQRIPQRRFGVYQTDDSWKVVVAQRLIEQEEELFIMLSLL
jgi:hypothetical protein